MRGDQRARTWALFIGVLLTLVLGSPRVSRAQAPSPYLGSVPTGQATGTTFELSLREAIDRALKYNLGVIEGEERTRAAHAIRLRALNALLSNVSARVSAASEQINFKAQGLNFHIPGVNIPTVAGPFGVTDARVYLTQEILNWSDIKRLKSSMASERASEYNSKSDREIVVFTTGNAYLAVISDVATVDSTRAQVRTAQALYQQDVDKNAQGVIARIDVLRAQVELQTQQQRLIAAENQLNIDKLTLARVIRHAPITSAPGRK
jgi:outer membrane protein TolC